MAGGKGSREEGEKQVEGGGWRKAESRGRKSEVGDADGKGEEILTQRRRGAEKRFCLTQYCILCGFESLR